MTDRGSLSGSIDVHGEAYEQAQQRNGSADIARHLPERGHVHYLAVLCELVRVDLEYSWLRGAPKGLDRYWARFPEIFDDARCVEQIAFEERRLRRLADDSSGVTPPRWAEIGGWPQRPTANRDAGRRHGPPSGCGLP
jgi:hypothetical protein